MPVAAAGLSYESFVDTARLVENTLPPGSTWDGTERPVPVRASTIELPPVAATAGDGQ